MFRQRNQDQIIGVDSVRNPLHISVVIYNAIKRCNCSVPESYSCFDAVPQFRMPLSEAIVQYPRHRVASTLYHNYSTNWSKCTFPLFGNNWLFLNHNQHCLATIAYFCIIHRCESLIVLPISLLLIRLYSQYYEINYANVKTRS